MGLVRALGVERAGKEYSEGAVVSSSDILVSCLLLLSLLDFGDTSQEMEGLLSFLPKRPMMVWVE